MGSKLVTNLPAPQVWQRSGSHSLTAKKHGHCLVLHCALQRQPGKRFWPSAGDGQSVIVPVNEKEKHERQVTKRKWNMCLKKIFLRFSWILQLVENFLHCTQCGKKNRIHRQWDIALDLPLNSHVSIKGNLLQRVRRIKIFS